MPNAGTLSSRGLCAEVAGVNSGLTVGPEQASFTLGWAGGSMGGGRVQEHWRDSMEAMSCELLAKHLLAPARQEPVSGTCSCHVGGPHPTDPYSQAGS